MSGRRRSTSAHRAAVVSAAGIVLALAIGAPGVAREVPFLSGRVVDEAGIIPAEAEERIAAKLAAFEEKTGAQVAVLTVDSLEGENLEDYALRVAETWGLGRAEADDGVLLLVAKNDRLMRIEVGYGLEPDLTDAQSGRILDGILRPAFRQGDFGGGIESGVDAILGTLEGLDVLPAAGGGGLQGLDAPLAIRGGALALFLAFISLFCFAALFTPGCQSWFLWLFLMPFLGLFPSAIMHPKAGMIVLGLWVIGFPIVKLLLGRTALGKRWTKAHPKWTTWAASSGRSSGGWSSGGSSFSGGGGSFGGGGASSSW